MICYKLNKKHNEIETEQQRSVGITNHRACI